MTATIQSNSSTTPTDGAASLAVFGKEPVGGDASNECPAEEPSASLSDDALALRFARNYPDLRYTAAWKKWHRWNETVWQEDRTIMVFHLIRGFARRIALSTRDKTIGSAGRISSIERLARSDRAYAALPEHWDAEDWVIATPGGVVDLRTGEARPARKEDYATKSTPVAPGGSCPLWLAFLDQVTGHDTTLQSFLQRMLGYCLTGSVRDHALFFLYGAGGNGKSTFLETARSILGDYSRTAPTGMLMASSYDRHPTDIAGLRSIRMAITTEIDEGRVWDAARIKSLTGGDSIAARLMRQDYFQFDPKFKLLIAGNNKPIIRNVDEAIRRRFHLIPFSVKINRPDPDFREKLKEEWPGILAWMIEGCLQWQEDGLSAPQAVADATTEYLHAQDIVGRWIVDDCETKPSFEEPTANLFESWKKWCEVENEQPGSIRALGDALIQRRGISRGQSGHEKTRVMIGIRLKVPSR